MRLLATADLGKNDMKDPHVCKVGEEMLSQWSLPGTEKPRQGFLNATHVHGWETAGMSFAVSSNDVFSL